MALSVAVRQALVRMLDEHFDLEDFKSLVLIHGGIDALDALGDIKAKPSTIVQYVAKLEKRGALEAEFFEVWRSLRPTYGEQVLAIEAAVRGLRPSHQGTQGDRDPSDQPDWTDYVVRITDGKRVVGSGFRIDKGHIVTCAHVMTNFTSSVDQVFVNGAGAKLIHDGTTDGVDIAVLSVSELTVPILVPNGRPELPRVGMDIVATGYRGGVIVSERGTIIGRANIPYPNETSRTAPALRVGLARPIERGQSGGPLIDPQSRRALGVLSHRQQDDSYAIAITALPETFLRPHRR